MAFRSSTIPLGVQGVWLLLLVLLVPIIAFSAVSPSGPKSDQAPKLSFHAELEKIGMTVFRPGGSKATRLMHEWVELPDSADSDKSTTVLELSAGLGTGGMALALSRGRNVLLTDIDEARLVQA